MENCVDCKRNPGSKHAAGGAYFLAFIGAAVYYLQHAASFGDGVLGVLKAMVWPALLVYRLLGFLGM
jgi:hypothetical protein